MSQPSSQPGSGSQMPIPASTSSSGPVPRLPIEQPDEDAIEVVEDLDVDVERRGKSGKKRRAPRRRLKLRHQNPRRKKLQKGMFFFGKISLKLMTKILFCVTLILVVRQESEGLMVPLLG
jgi:hypothetical protein